MYFCDTETTRQTGEDLNESYAKRAVAKVELTSQKLFLVSPINQQIKPPCYTAPVGGVTDRKIERNLDLGVRPFCWRDAYRNIGRKASFQHTGFNFSQCIFGDGEKMLSIRRGRQVTRTIQSPFNELKQRSQEKNM